MNQVNSESEENLMQKPIKLRHRKFLGIKYPKFLIFILTLIVAYIIFTERNLEPVRNVLSALGYFGSFLAGMFYTYGFSSIPASAIFLILGENQNIFIAAMLGGFGALLGDLLIFKLIRIGFDNEVRLLEHEHMVKYFDNKIPISVKKFLLPIFGVVIIASPLPDEIGVSLIAISRKVPQKVFMIISYLANTLGILALLWIGSSL